jgi:hypothetical protein
LTQCNAIGRFCHCEWCSNMGERRAHVPLGAGSEVTHGVEVVITGNHVNRTAPSGCVARLVRLPEL